MKFEKKVIIGSIGGFFTTIVGIIAVFFPSLLNFEKKSMEEIKVFIQSEEDVRDFKNKILKNTGKLVSIDLEYCYYHDLFFNNDKNNKVEYFLTPPYTITLNDNEFTDQTSDNASMYGTIQTKEGLSERDGGNIETGMIVAGYTESMYETQTPYRLYGGSFILSGENENENMVISIPYRTKKKYEWENSGEQIELIGSEYEDMKPLCKPLIKNNGETYSDSYLPLYHERLKGIFFVHEKEYENRQSEDNFDVIINLEPFNKKDLAIRDY